MRKRLILPAFFVFSSLALACGGGDTTTTTTTLGEDGDLTTTTSTEPAADAVQVGGEALGKWGDPQSEMKKRLTTLGWGVESCDMFKDEGKVYSSCQASKGDLWAEVEVNDYEDRQSAEWMSEDDPSAFRDGKRVLSVTVYDGGVAKTLGEMVLPPGTKLDDFDMTAASKTLQGKGWQIEEMSTSTSDGYTMNEMAGSKGLNILVIETEFETGSRLSRDTRTIEEGLFFVEQGDEAYFTAVVLDQAKGASLLKSLGGR